MWWWLACSSRTADPLVGWTGGATLAPGPAPERFSGPLTTLPMPEARPLAAVRHAVCSGRPGAREALLEAIAATPADTRDAWADVTGMVDCRDPGYCAWVDEQVAASAPADRAIWQVASWSCLGDERATALLRSAPDHLILAFVEYAWHRSEPLPWDDQLAVVARAAFADGRASDQLLRGLASMPDPRGRALVRELADTVSGERRDRALAALDGSLDPGEAYLAEVACSELGLPDCIGRSAISDLPSAVRLGLDVRALPARWPNHTAALAEGLVGCVAGYDASSAHACAEALATLSPAVAEVAIAASPHATSLRDVIVDPVAADAAFADCGFPVPPGTAGATGAERLADAGHGVRVRAVSFDDDGSGLPYRLSAAAGMNDTEYAVLAPVGFDGDRAFLGWRGPLRHRVVGEPGFGWDLVAGTRLVNAQLEAAGDERRLVPDAAHTTWILGSPDALSCVADLGYVTFAADPSPVPAAESP